MAKLTMNERPALPESYSRKHPDEVRIGRAVAALAEEKEMADEPQRKSNYGLDQFIRGKQKKPDVLDVPSISHDKHQEEEDNGI